MTRPKNQSESLLLSITENCEKPYEQIHTRPQKTQEFSLTQPGETLAFKPPINLGLDTKLMLGYTSLEVRNSVS